MIHKGYFKGVFHGSNTREIVYGFANLRQIPTEVMESVTGCKHLQLCQVYPQQTWRWK